MRTHSSPPLPTEKPRAHADPSLKDKPVLLWVGDAVAATGFARGTHKITDALKPHFKKIHILGLNFFGDPHPFKNLDGSTMDIYPAFTGGDHMGWGRMRGMVDAIKPDVIVIQNDPWNIPGYLADGACKDVPVVGAIAIDGKNALGSALNGLTHAIFWTKFAEEQAWMGGYFGTSSVIPLGVDIELYQPGDREALRARFLNQVLENRGMPQNSFVVGVVGRNQWRKRLDLTMQYFADWIHEKNIRDACLWLHSGATSDNAWDLDNMAHYYGITDRVMIPKFPIKNTGFPEDVMTRLYGMFDALLTTTMGEGFWLPGFEAAACGTPIIAPDWSACGEFFRGAAHLVPCTSTAIHPSQTNTIGGVADRAGTIAALDEVYRSQGALRGEGLARVNEERFRWEHIGAAYNKVLQKVLIKEPELAQV